MLNSVFTPIQTFIIIIAVTVGAMFTRFLPFIAFPQGRELPPFVAYLGKLLPAAMAGLLVVYCFRTDTICKYWIYLGKL